MSDGPESNQEDDNTHSDHTIPPAPDKRVVGGYLFSNPLSKRRVVAYIESQTHGEKVQLAEKVKSERVLERDIDCWDVHTDRNRYWVLTSPTNLYSQTAFPSLDYTLTFHVGLIVRMEAIQRGAPNETQRLRLTSVWRRWEDALATYDHSEEAEDFQAVGMKCRECLIQLVRTISDSHVGLAEKKDLPKRSDVNHWSEVLADTLAPGSRNGDIRRYLKATTKAAWDLVNWLTHAMGATRADAAMALDATSLAVASFGATLVRHESRSPDKCPHCGSYVIETIYSPELGPHAYVSVCEKCYWQSDE